jgi:hypothetical protein
MIIIFILNYLYIKYNMDLIKLIENITHEYLNEGVNNISQNISNKYLNKNVMYHCSDDFRKKI